MNQINAQANNPQVQRPWYYIYVENRLAIV